MNGTQRGPFPWERLRPRWSPPFMEHVSEQHQGRPPHKDGEMSGPTDLVTGMRQASPVSPWGWSTGFDSGEPLCRRNTESTTSAPIDRNSLCQFWNDSNQKREVAT